MIFIDFFVIYVTSCEVKIKKTVSIVKTIQLLLTLDPFPKALLHLNHTIKSFSEQHLPLDRSRRRRVELNAAGSSLVLSVPLQRSRRALIQQLILITSVWYLFTTSQPHKIIKLRVYFCRRLSLTRAVYTFQQPLLMMRQLHYFSSSYIHQPIVPHAERHLL